jgi:hypothetical protein
MALLQAASAVILLLIPAPYLQLLDSQTRPPWVIFDGFTRVTVIIPAIEPTPNPTTPNQVALMQRLSLPIDSGVY